MPLDTTPGSATANSYPSLTEANEYNDAHISGWSGTDAEKEVALQMATSLMDYYFIWTGSAVDAVQALSWPRNGMLSRNGFAIPNTEIPRDLKRATSELARLLRIGDTTAVSDVSANGITELKAGPVTLKFDLEKIKSQPIPLSVLFMIPRSWYERLITDPEPEYAEIVVL